jgi:uncharacterized membrane protein YfcA
MSTSQILVLCVAMVITGAVGAITGGNSLVNVPIMIMVGMSPRQAVATNMFAVTFMTISATARFAREGLIRFKLAVPLGIIAIVTSAIGAELAVKMPETAVKAIVGVSMAVLVVFMIINPKAAPAGSAAAKQRATAGYVASTLLGIYGGLFSGGYTTLMTFLCVAAFGLTMLEAVAVTKPVNLVSCVAASIVFFAGGLIDLRVGVPLAGANLLGGWLGAHFAVKASQKTVRVLFLASVGALAAKLLVYDVVVKSWLAGPR